MLAWRMLLAPFWAEYFFGLSKETLGTPQAGMERDAPPRAVVQKPLKP
jgi:hypothetical protein